MSHSEADAPFINIVRLTAAPGKEQQLRDAILATVEPARAAEGNVGFTVHVSRDDPREILIFEAWENGASLIKHADDPATIAFQKFDKDNNLTVKEPEQTHWKEITQPSK